MQYEVDFESTETHGYIDVDAGEYRQWPKEYRTLNSIKGDIIAAIQNEYSERFRLYFDDSRVEYVARMILEELSAEDSEDAHNL